MPKEIKKQQLIDRDKLRGECVANKITMNDLAKLLGISRNGLYRKLEGEFAFNEYEIAFLMKKFGKKIFF